MQNTLKPILTVVDHAGKYGKSTKLPTEVEYDAWKTMQLQTHPRGFPSGLEMDLWLPFMLIDHSVLHGKKIKFFREFFMEADIAMLLFR